MAAEIELKGITKSYKTDLFKKPVKALRGVDLAIGKGEVYGLIGPNGSGKSTTIRVILGLIRPDSGGVFFRGKPLSETSIQNVVGYLPENPYLYDHLTLSELLTFCARTSGISREEASARKDALLARLSLEHAARRPLRTFSKGMLQRAAICFALLHNPSLVVLDEPMSGLDPVGRKMVFDLVNELKEEGKTIFFCSHILSDVERLCDRIGLLSQGRLIESFETETLISGRQGQVHLKVDRLDAKQKESLAAILDRVTETEGGVLLTVNAANLEALAGRLNQFGVSIRGSREDRVTLEELFMRSIQGGEQ